MAIPVAPFSFLPVCLFVLAVDVIRLFHYPVYFGTTVVSGWNNLVSILTFTILQAIIKVIIP